MILIHIYPGVALNAACEMSGTGERERNEEEKQREREKERRSKRKNMQGRRGFGERRSIVLIR